MREKDQQLSEEKKRRVKEKESMEGTCSQSDLSPGQRVCKMSLGSFASWFSSKVAAGID